MRRRDGSPYVPALRVHWLTPIYDIVVRITTRERTFKEALIRQTAIAPGHEVLDLGCGTGTLSLWIKKAYPHANVVGVDGDSAILGVAARKAQRAGLAVHFDEAMSYDLPYRDAHFDRVVSSLFFHHLSLEDEGRTMKELHRVLKPGGEVHVADWGKATSHVMRALFLMIQLLDGFTNTQDNVSGKLIELLERAGLFDVSERRTFNTIFGTMALYSGEKGRTANCSITVNTGIELHTFTGENCTRWAEVGASRQVAVASFGRDRDRAGVSAERV